ncbi:DUF2163 domain-containing protein [Planktotalea sp.]|uniref:DUF2163 domain-containing protein n=1 Tax=Planktotalea sp. TaxID=2029877 RepID=UPI003D6B9D51
MSAFPETLQAHLDTGVTTLCRAWKIERSDGIVYGFTDHDLALDFEGMTFKPDTGLSALALQQSTGLSVDNTEAIGAISDAAITDSDIDAGRFDGAEVTSWLLNWADTRQRIVQFRGNIGEIRRTGGAFQAELRGLTDMLNRPVGRVYQRPCVAVLGDSACGVAVQSAIYRAERSVVQVENARVFRFSDLSGFDSAWFERGVLTVLSGGAANLTAAIKVDRTRNGLREITLWEPLRANIVAGDIVALTAGCDKRFETCRLKFSNALNYRGFPDIPEEEWMMVHPSKAPALDGGSRR